MPVGSSVQLIEALASLDYESIRGTPESDLLDFKSEPYRLDEAPQKWELAKDVAALANAGGGHLVIGVSTTRPPTQLVEIADAVRPIPKALVNVDQYRGVIADWIYPRVRNVTQQWVPDDGAVDHGIFVIEVPPQRDSDKYFMVRRMVTDGVESGAFGVPIREGDRVVWMPIPEVHRLMERGRTVLATPEPAPSPPENWDEVLVQVEQTQDWSETPYYALQGGPDSPGEPQLTGMYGRSEGIWAALREPRSLRSAGFNLRTGGEPEVDEGGLLVRSAREVVRVDPNGLLTVCATADPQFLGWAVNDRATDDRMAINAIALVEFTLEAMIFLHGEVMPRLDAIHQWRARLRCRLFETGGVHLGPGWGRAGFFSRLDLRPASSDNWTRSFRIAATPEESAFAALCQVYALFGYPPEAIPFTEAGAVSRDAILAA